MSALVKAGYGVTATKLSNDRETTIGNAFHVTEGGLFCTDKAGCAQFENEALAEDFILWYLMQLPGSYYYRFQIILPNGEGFATYQTRERV